VIDASGKEQCWIENDLCKIRLGNKIAICDKEFFHAVRIFRWMLSPQGYVIGKKPLHRLLLYGHKIVHHKNQNPLDNRLENLQGCQDDREHYEIHRKMAKEDDEKTMKDLESARLHEVSQVAINKRVHGALKLIASYEGKTITQYADDALLNAMRTGAGKDNFIKSIIDKLEVK